MIHIYYISRDRITCMEVDDTAWDNNLHVYYSLHIYIYIVFHADT
jgi:hypothetical protein